MFVEFGDCQYDYESRRLMRGGKQFHLSRKAFHLLNLLIEARPRVLSKAELHKELWPAVFVADDSLTKLINEIRRAIGESSREPRFVRTVHGVGYAFSGETRVSGLGAVVPSTARCWMIIDGRTIRLGAGENVIGRDPDAEIVLDRPRVSRRHARVVVGPTRVEIEDLASKNGTYVRGQRITGPVALQHGDDIRVGPVVLAFRQREMLAPTESEIG